MNRAYLFTKPDHYKLGQLGDLGIGLHGICYG